jgi:hypothetical protein
VVVGLALLQRHVRVTDNFTPRLHVQRKAGVRTPREVVEAELAQVHGHAIHVQPAQLLADDVQAFQVIYRMVVLQRRRRLSHGSGGGAPDGLKIEALV